ncbi:type II secretion system F family protein [Litorivivens sp.]|uniref:type II secretion system F family protein n=1 Tax=Litorivivens sp. TaxID=2020868 RepID=UPI0035641CB9
MLDIALLAGCAILVCAGILLLRGGQQKEASEAPLQIVESEVPEYRVSSLRQSLQTLNWRVEPLLLLGILGGSSLCVVLVFLEFFPESYHLASLAGLAALVMTYFLINDVSRMIRHKFEEKLVDALDLIHAAVAGGVSPQRALLVAANASKGAIARELREVASRLDYGLPIDRAVERMQYRYNSDGVRLFKQALLAKWQSGTGFAPLLQSLSTLLRERTKLRIQIAAQLSGSRYAAIFTGALPYLLVPLFLWKQPEWFEPLKASEHGPMYLLAAVVSQVLGYLWLRRLLRVEL